MSADTHRIGLVAGEPAGLMEDPEVFAAPLERVAVEADSATLLSTRVDAWCVWTPGLAPDVVRAVFQHGAPALFLTTREEGAGLLRRMSRTVHDIAWLPADAEEIHARLRRQVNVALQWNELGSMVVREIAHDLRGPLQALTFVMQAMSKDGLPESLSKDVEMLGRTVDICDVFATAISNIGHHPNQPWRAGKGAEGVKEVELSAVIQGIVARPMFAGRITAEVGEIMHVRAQPSLLQRAMLDVIRVACHRIRSGRTARAQGFRSGDHIVFTVHAPAYPGMLAHAHKLTTRHDPIVTRRRHRNALMPFAGLAYASEAIRAMGGSLMPRRRDDELELEVRLPAA